MRIEMVKITTKQGKAWRVYREGVVSLDKPDTHLQRMYHDEQDNAWIETHEGQHIMLDKSKRQRAGNAVYVRQS
jgi:hypothetical protein